MAKWSATASLSIGYWATGRCFSDAGDADERRSLEGYLCESLMSRCDALCKSLTTDRKRKSSGRRSSLRVWKGFQRAGGSTFTMTGLFVYPGLFVYLSRRFCFVEQANIFRYNPKLVKQKRTNPFPYQLVLGITFNGVRCIPGSFCADSRRKMQPQPNSRLFFECEANRLAMKTDGLLASLRVASCRIGSGPYGRGAVAPASS